MSLLKSNLILRQLSNKITQSKNSPQIDKILKRSSHTFYYRSAVEKHPKKVVILANLVGGSCWFWMLYHIFTEYEHITGEFPYPDPSKWTNEELGIPDDEEGL